MSDITSKMLEELWFKIVESNLGEPPNKIYVAATDHNDEAIEAYNAGKISDDSLLAILAGRASLPWSVVDRS